MAISPPCPHMHVFPLFNLYYSLIRGHFDGVQPMKKIELIDLQLFYSTGQAAERCPCTFLGGAEFTLCPFDTLRQRPCRRWRDQENERKCDQTTVGGAERRDQTRGSTRRIWNWRNVLPLKGR
jgi:hypothetical protein